MNSDAYPTAADVRDIANTRQTGIVHVVDCLEMGGLERVVTDLAIEQARCGHRVAVFSITGSGGFAAELEAAGVAVVVGGKRRAFDSRVIRALRRAAIDCDADIVHTHNFVPNYDAAIALAWPSGQRRVLVNTCHNMGSRLSNRRLRWLYRLSLRSTARVAMVGAQVQ
ncbi:glycosyltransferase family 4 protein, partial [Lysobacter sp. A03]|uniref:glycosyltransferase family 4 protein n=1 Tax=Lysobacter sp. A03 TaxID=1199154 RepID=UPI000AFB69D3